MRNATKQADAPEVIFVGCADAEGNRTYAGSYRLKIPLVTPDDTDHVVDSCQVRKYPTVFALDEGGVIRARRNCRERASCRAALASVR